MRLLLFAAGLLLASAWVVNAAEPTFSVIAEPANIPVSYRADKGEGQITVTTAAPEGLPALYVRAFPLKLGNETASIVFRGSGQGWIELPKTPDKKRVIPFDVSGLEATGIYEGQIEVMSKEQNSAAVSTKIVVVHSDPGFAPVVGGAAYKDGQISFTTADPAVPVTFTVQLPATSRKRKLEIVLSEPLGKLLEAIPAEFTLSPGESKTIHLKPNPDMPVKISTGALTIRDFNNKDLAAEVFVSATRVDSVGTRTKLLFASVFLGALISVLLNNIFPVSLAKRKTRQALTNIEGAIRSCGGVTPALLSDLLADSARVRLLNGAFGWYTTTKTEQMQQVATFVKELQDNVATANDISAQRLRSSAISVRWSEQAEEKLCDAEKALIANKSDLAKKLVEEARTMIDNAASSAVLKELRTELAKDIDSLQAKAAGGPPPHCPRPAYIDALVKKLVADKAALQSLPDRQVLDMERDHHIAWTYVRDFEPNATAGSNLEKSQDEFLSALRNATTSTKTRMVVLLARAGLAPQDIADALAANKSPRIQSDDEVVAYQMADFRLVFDNPAFDVDAVRRLCTYKWRFGDNTPSPLSDFCRHFYLAPRDEESQLAKRTLRRIGRKLGLAAPNSATYEVSVAVTPPVNGSAASSFYKKVTVLPARERGVGAIGIEVATFFISFSIAVVAAYGAQYSTLPTADSWSVFITAFMFGFGLDQIRDRASPPR